MDYDREHEERYLKLNGKLPVGTSVCILVIGFFLGFLCCHKMYTGDGGKRVELPETPAIEQ